MRIARYQDVAHTIIVGVDADRRLGDNRGVVVDADIAMDSGVWRIGYARRRACPRQVARRNAVGACIDRARGSRDRNRAGSGRHRRALVLRKYTGGSGIDSHSGCRGYIDRAQRRDRRNTLRCCAGDGCAAADNDVERASAANTSADSDGAA